MRYRGRVKCGCCLGRGDSQVADMRRYIRMHAVHVRRRLDHTADDSDFTRVTRALHPTSCLALEFTDYSPWQRRRMSARLDPSHGLPQWCVSASSPSAAATSPAPSSAAGDVASDAEDKRGQPEGTKDADGDAAASGDGAGGHVLLERGGHGAGTGGDVDSSTARGRAGGPGGAVLAGVTRSETAPQQSE